VRPRLHSSILWVGRASGRACGRKPKRHGHPAPLSQQREFLATLDAMSDCDQVRRLREQTLKYIRERERGESQAPGAERSSLIAVAVQGREQHEGVSFKRKICRRPSRAD
jgi:hypothetical protein